MFAKLPMSGGMGPPSLVLRPGGIRSSLIKFNSVFSSNPDLSHDSNHNCCGFQFGFELVYGILLPPSHFFKSRSFCSICFGNGRESKLSFCGLWNENNVNNKFSMQNIKSKSTSFETTINICQEISMSTINSVYTHCCCWCCLKCCTVIASYTALS